MRNITTASGTVIELDGDALAISETISRDIARRHGLDYGFEEVEQQFQQLVSQMSDEELRTYLKECLVMSFNRFENDRMLSIVRRAGQARETE